MASAGSPAQRTWWPGGRDSTKAINRILPVGLVVADDIALLPISVRLAQAPPEKELRP